MKLVGVVWMFVRIRCWENLKWVRIDIFVLKCGKIAKVVRNACWPVLMMPSNMFICKIIRLMSKPVSLCVWRAMGRI